MSESNESQKPLHFDLRTRIAAALKTANDRVAGFIGYDEMADAVIRELGLRQESTNRVIYPDLPAEIINGKKYTRYITDWRANDEQSA